MTAGGPPPRPHHRNERCGGRGPGPRNLPHGPRSQSVNNVSHGSSSGAGLGDIQDIHTIHPTGVSASLALTRGCKFFQRRLCSCTCNQARQFCCLTGTVSHHKINSHSFSGQACPVCQKTNNSHIKTGHHFNRMK